MSRNLPISREDLYKLVWSKPMLRVAERFGVSSSYLARVCTNLNVPRPQRGHWAKLAAGKTVAVPKLPEAKLGEPIEWSKEGLVRRLSIARSEAQIVPRTASKSVSVVTSGEHKLLRNSRPFYTKCRFSHDAGYLRPDKKLLPDITVSEPSLERALTYMNNLFLTLEKRGHCVSFAPYGSRFRRESIDRKLTPNKLVDYQPLWSPSRPTIVYIGNVAIGLTLIELSEEIEMVYMNGKYIRKSEITPEIRRKAARTHTWETAKSTTTGKFRLHAYSPYYHADWSKVWDEGKKLSFTKNISNIVKTLEKANPELLRLIKEGEIRSELWSFASEIGHEKRRRERNQERKLQARKDSTSQLIETIAAWDEAVRIQRFFSEAEQLTTTLGGENKFQVLDRLNLARELVGNSDVIKIITSWKTPKEILRESKRSTFDDWD